MYDEREHEAAKVDDMKFFYLGQINALPIVDPARPTKANPPVSIFEATNEINGVVGLSGASSSRFTSSYIDLLHK